MFGFPVRVGRAGRARTVLPRNDRVKAQCINVGRRTVRVRRVASILKGIYGTQPQNAGELIKSATRFVDERRIGEIGERETVAIVSADPCVELVGERIVEEHARRTRCALGGSERHAQSYARGTAAV